MEPQTCILQSLAGGVAIALTYIILFHLKLSGSKFPYPSGPTGANMPIHDPWVQYQAWGEEYGKLVYIRESNTLIVNHLDVAYDLLEKRARNYADRPVWRVGDRIGAGSINFTFQRYSNKWRKSRRTFMQHFRQATIGQFHTAQYEEVHVFLQRLAKTPTDFLQHIQTFSQGIIYSALYGFHVEQDDYVTRHSAPLIQELFNSVLAPFPLLEWFPWLERLPRWLPGCGYKQAADQALKGFMELKDVSFNRAMERFEHGSKNSLIAESAMKHAGSPEEVDGIKIMGVASSIASFVTISSVVNSFMLAMVMHPYAQAKGQEEIDRVIGRDRLPIFEDRQLLPYVEAIYREVMRLNPPLPLCVAHVSIEDDVYRGYYIPKGCTVIPNIWAMNRDPSLYPDPDNFRPERFFEAPRPFTSINDIPAFGFGRRVCAGRYISDGTVWLTIACALASFKMGKGKDEEGNEIDVAGGYMSSPGLGFFRHPEPYKCSIVPRGPHVATETGEKDLIG
ncbi:hypothetical protein D9757_007341 [Collybiopsis confluens]|uniref:Cytochrome P450 n=1 Tax=Collybiopsis confluens TaxID=2823264 RepID=A0A8H5M6R8_9AGAR|nr:hypothetical protein D9757_007341 [Collybiopsis confluens]